MIDQNNIKTIPLDRLEINYLTTHFTSKHMFTTHEHYKYCPILLRYTVQCTYKVNGY